MAANARTAAILFLVATTCLDVSRAGCEVDDVAVYKVLLTTFWSENAFPKDYPSNWPKAQWSQVFGQSHNASYSLYKIGEVAREPVRIFSQYGKLDELVVHGDEDPRVYDQFSAAALRKGVGETENMVFVDGAHSLVSLICKLIPSPDWFVGVDSLDLCVDAAWVDQVKLELHPLDAGAASGRTFTAPRWQTSPPEPVTRHGPRCPDHPSAGFYYPDLRQLPAIAAVQFTKVKEYTTIEVNNMARKELLSILKLKNAMKGLPKKFALRRINSELTTENNVDRLKDLEEEPRKDIPEGAEHKDDVTVVTRAPTSTSTTETEFGSQYHSMDEVMLAVAKGKRLGRGGHLPRHFRSRLHHAVNRISPADCLVSEWGPWSECSVTCGFGEQVRRRAMVRAAGVGGRSCPPLRERQHCTMEACYHMDYFEW